MRPVWNALQDAIDITKLMRLVVAGARPNVEQMRTHASETFTNATEVANRVAASGLLTPYAKSLQCIGGIHLDPAFSDAVLSGNRAIAVTHILPNSWLIAGDYHEESAQHKLQSCIASIAGGVDAIVQHHSLKASDKAAVDRIASRLNLPVMDHHALRKGLQQVECVHQNTGESGHA